MRGIVGQHLEAFYPPALISGSRVLYYYYYYYTSIL
jgi:hypothetical protein